MQKYAFENVFFEIAADLSRFHYVDVSANICCNSIYRQVSNIWGTLVGNYIVDNSDVVGASPIVLHFTLGFNMLDKDNCRPTQKNLSSGVWCPLY